MKSNRESLLRRMQDFDPAIISLCQKTTEILPLLKCADRKPLRRLYLSRLVFIGDAAHPMLPNFGQGAGMASVASSITAVNTAVK